MTTLGPGYWCSLCEQLFETREALREHWHRVHRLAEPPETWRGVPPNRAPQGVEWLRQPLHPQQTTAE